jgi:proteasome lid subunit RPN8/RPN11
MEDFLELDPTIIKHKNLLLSIKKLLLNNYPFESGGLVDKNLNILSYPSLQNDCHSYYPPPQFFVSVVKKKIIFSFHSHLHILDPSEEDIFFLKNYDIPIIIYSLNYDCFLSVNIKNEGSRITWNTQKINLS